MRSDENNMSHLRIAFQTMKDYWKMSIILIVVFMGIVAMYSAVYPAFKDNLQDMASTLQMNIFLHKRLRTLDDLSRFSQYGIISNILASNSWHNNWFQLHHLSQKK